MLVLTCSFHHVTVVTAVTAGVVTRALKQEATYQVSFASAKQPRYLPGVHVLIISTYLLTYPPTYPLAPSPTIEPPANTGKASSAFLYFCTRLVVVA